MFLESACILLLSLSAEPSRAAVNAFPEPPTVWHGIDSQKEYLAGVLGITASDGDARWKASELANAIGVMLELPSSFRSCTQGLRRIKAGRKEGVTGYVEMNVAPVAFITDAGADYHGISGWLVHEMTHCFQMAHPDILEAWEEKFWNIFVFFSSPRTPSATGYGNDSPKNDMAESVRRYWELGRGMKASFPDRYEFIRVHIMSGMEFEPHPTPT
ncbi:MAG: hypothetical protein WCU88_10315 [Elusimicrobiota bacterium]|jgi:hypothetical protein